MILSKEVNVTMNNRYVSEYIKKGYNTKGGETILVKIEDLTLKSNVLIDVVCDKCKIQKQMQYNHYNKYTNNQKEEYLCNKCNNIKRIITNNKRYGCDNVFQSEEKKEKRRKTMIEKYGDEHALNVKELKEKQINTNNEKFGFDYASQNEEIKQKIEDTFMKNYGVKTSLLDPNTIEKIKQTNIEKYGADNVFKLREFKEEKMVEKYDVEYPGQSIDIQNKIKETNIKKYGSKSTLSNPNIIKKIIQTKTEKGIYHTEEQRTDYKNYWLKVKVVTSKHKKELFENWDGTDFYDGEYIKDNFYLPSGSKEYPTIDHKISVSYGFKNNISPEEIGKLENLCITKRSINSSKNSKNLI